jgi:hypothetical protein
MNTMDFGPNEPVPSGPADDAIRLFEECKRLATSMGLRIVAFQVLNDAGWRTDLIPKLDPRNRLSAIPGAPTPNYWVYEAQEITAVQWASLRPQNCPEALWSSTHGLKAVITSWIGRERAGRAFPLGWDRIVQFRDEVWEARERQIAGDEATDHAVKESSEGARINSSPWGGD